jgi:hypothetical protein
MIPNTIHFVFGLDKNFGGKPFSFLHFSAVYSAWKVNRPDKILFHYHYEPDTVWWREAKRYVQPNRVEIPDEVFGNPISHFAHKADVIRLRQLMEHGGIYMDLDVVSLNSFGSLRDHEMVMGQQAGTGLCNAVILAAAGSRFLKMWYESYKAFNKDEWSRHSVMLPFELWRDHPDCIHVEGPYSFFYPVFNEPAGAYLWAQKVSPKHRVGWMCRRMLGRFREPANFHSPLRCIGHTLRTTAWHERMLSRSYCVHLWEQLWWDKYLKDFSPSRILEGASSFARVFRNMMGEAELVRVARIWNE